MPGGDHRDQNQENQPVTLLPTTIVGSLPQPDWMIDRKRLAEQPPPRVRALDLWRVPEAWLDAAMDDATLLAIRVQEDAGLDIVGDGEIRRESYSNHLANALSGVDLDHPGTVISRAGRETLVPRIVGPVKRLHAVETGPLGFLRKHTTRQVKVTVPGPFTMSQLVHDDYYGDPGKLAMALAVCVREEIRDLFAAGADIVQIDEPYLQAQPEKARAYGLAALNSALEGAAGTTAVHLCFGYAAMVRDRPNGYSFLAELAACPCDIVSIETAQCGLDCSVLAKLEGKKVMLGVIDMSKNDIEAPETVAARIRRALPFVKAENLLIAPDCGMKYLPREVAAGKLRAMVGGAAIVRAELQRK